MCEFISQRYTYVSGSSPLRLSLRNLRRASLDRIEAYADKGNFTSSKRERSLLRDFLLICEFISMTSILDFRKQVANTLFVESGKSYLEALRGLWWKRKYPHIITMEKLSERLLLMCYFITQNSTLHSWNCWLTLLSWILYSDIWEPLWVQYEKGSILT